MDIKVVDDLTGEEIKTDGQEIKELKQSDTSPVKIGEIMVQQVGQIFDLTPIQCQKYINKLNTLIDYAKTQTDDHTAEGIKWAVRSLQGKVGTPPLGQKWLPYLTEYAHLKLESIEREKMLNKFERNP